MSEGRQADRRWIVRVLLYAMLVASAGAAVTLNDSLWRSARERSLPVWAPLLPACIFTAFVIVYLVDRWLLVRRRRYPPVRAFFQVAIAVAFAALLWPQQASELLRTRMGSPTAGGLERLLGHRDADVRAAACELAAWRREGRLRERIEALAAGETVPAVRDACRDAAASLGGAPAPP